MVSSRATAPDVEFDGALIAQGHKLFDVDGKLWLPRNAHDVGAIELGTFAQTDWGHAQAMMRGDSVELRARSLGGRTMAVHAMGVWLDSGPARFANEDRPRRAELNVGHIDRVTITETLPASGLSDDESKSREDDNANLAFQLTDTNYVFVGGAKVMYPTGAIEVRHHRTMDMKHPRLGGLSFDRHHRFHHAGGAERSTTITSQLEVAVRGGESSCSVSDLEVAAARADVDDVCLLLSFAARHRISVTGWTRYSLNMFERTLLSPLDSLNPSRHEPSVEVLIDRTQTAKFLEATTAKFAALPAPEQRAVRRALYPLLPMRARVLEHSIVSLFSAFEGLLEPYRVRRKLQRTVGSNATWKAVERALRTAIDNVTVNDEGFDRESMKGRLAELKHLPLHVAALRFLTEYGVPVEDLWPAFGKPGEKVTLYALRNALAHGVPLGERAFVALLSAELHLRTLLERAVLAILGWDIEESGASPSAMRRAGYNGFEDFPVHRALLTAAR